MTDIRRVPTADRAWLMASLREALDGRIAVQPIAAEDTPEPPELLPGTAVVIHTSGSTGEPKFVAHSAESLRAGAEATNEILGGSGEWLVALPTHLIAGLQMLTRSALGESSPLFLTGKFKPEKFFELARHLDAERRYTSLVPVQLAQLLQVAEHDAAALAVLQRFDAILVGGQAVPLAMRALAHKLGLKLVRTYGMTETGGGVVYDGVEIGDTQMRIRDGEIQLAGSSLALGYLGDAALTERQFIVDQGTRWYRTGDAGSLLGGMLQVNGRLDRVIVSGGVNVSLDRVETFVDEEPSWGAATAALAVDSTEWGERVVLVAETSAGGAAKLGAVATEHERERLEAGFATLQERVKAVLGAAAAPIHLSTLARLPRLANGKVDYRQLSTLVEKDVK